MGLFLTIFLAALGCASALIGYFQKDKDGKRISGAGVLIVITIFILIASVAKGIDDGNNSAELKHTSDSLTHLHSDIKNISDTLNTTRDTLLKVGIRIDNKTNRILILDSQLLKQRFTQIFVSNTYLNDNKKKLSGFFSDLENPDYNKQQIALNYILENFPDTLSKYQLDKLHTYLLKNNIEPKLMAVLFEQPPSSYLESILKEVILKKVPGEQYAWKYLFSKTNTGLKFVKTVVKSNTYNSWSNFSQICEAVIYSGNSKVAFDILNSKELIEFLLANQNKDMTESAYSQLNGITNNYPKYKKYRNSYFFKTEKVG